MKTRKVIYLLFVFVAVSLQPSYSGWWNTPDTIENETCILKVNQIPKYCDYETYSELQTIKKDLEDKGYTFKSQNEETQSFLSFVIGQTQMQGETVSANLILKSLNDIHIANIFRTKIVSVGSSFFMPHTQSTEEKIRILKLKLCGAVIDFLNDLPYCEVTSRQFLVNN